MGREGFGLAEIVVVALLAAVTVAGVYRTLIVQERSYEAAGVPGHGQEALRAAVGVMESELREIGSIGGVDIGGSDIAVAGRDSIRFRAQRKLGFVCRRSRNGTGVLAWPIGDAFTEGDQLLIFVDGDTLVYGDDAWDTVTVERARPAEDADCADRWPGMPLQRLDVDAVADLAGVHDGAPLRAWEWVGYGLHRFDGAWGLVRSAAGREPTFMVGGLAPPGQGLAFEYFTPAGTPTDDVTRVARVRITLKTDPEAGSTLESTSLTTDLYLRNN
jgi:hypothetical protein